MIAKYWSLTISGVSISAGLKVILCIRFNDSLELSEPEESLANTSNNLRRKEASRSI